MDLQSAANRSNGTAVSDGLNHLVWVLCLSYSAHAQFFSARAEEARLAGQWQGIWRQSKWCCRTKLQARGCYLDEELVLVLDCPLLGVAVEEVSAALGLGQVLRVGLGGWASGAGWCVCVGGDGIIVKRTGGEPTATDPCAMQQVHRCRGTVALEMELSPSLSQSPR